MRRAISRQRIHADDTFHASIAISDSESDCGYCEEHDFSKVQIWQDDDEYFFSSISNIKEEFIILNNKKRERDAFRISKASTATLKKAASSSCLHSGLNNFSPNALSTTHVIPAKLSEISCPSKMTKHLSYNFLPNEANGKLVKKKAIKKNKKPSKRRPEPVKRSSSFMTEGEQSEVLYSSIPDDLKSHIMSFLSISDLRSFMSTSYRNMALCRSEHLWLKFCEQNWVLMKNLQDSDIEKRSYFDSHKLIQLEENFSIPIIPHPSQRTHKRIFAFGHHREKKSKEIMHDDVIDWDVLCPNRANLSVLLHLTQPYPVKVNEYFFSARDKHTSINDTIAPMQQNQNIVPEFRQYQMAVESKAFPVKRDTEVVQFTSKVGTGDRCIRSDKAFPCVQSSNTRRFPQLNLLGHIAKATGRSTHQGNPEVHQSHHSPLQDMLKLGKRFWTYSTIKPFVSPIVSKIEEKESNGRKEKIYTMNVSPRLVAYFEITLLSRDQSQEPSPLKASGSQTLSIQNTLDNFNESVASDCVAIGLSNQYFNTSGKMPGWDQYSYGYHGDDGGLFHAGGMMVRSYGPVFGVGDTVGCGIDYLKREIFFTINGKTLGFAWKDIDLSDPYYPTVGIDTQNPIELNFGSAPFAFDINSFSTDHSGAINDALRDLPK